MTIGLLKEIWCVCDVAAGAAMIVTVELRMTAMAATVARTTVMAATVMALAAAMTAVRVMATAVATATAAAMAMAAAKAALICCQYHCPHRKQSLLLLP